MTPNTNGNSRNNKWKDASAIALHYESVARSYASSEMNHTEYLKQHLYFVTLTSENSARKQMIDFSKVYFATCKDLLGNRLQRKKRLQPFGYGYVDHQGSKCGGKLSMKFWSLPHVHAVLLVPPGINNRFADNFKLHADAQRGTISCDIRNFDFQNYSIKDTITYCSKGYWTAFEADPGHDTLWQIFPK